MVDPVEQCSACGQTLWSEVRYCPFCGAPATAEAAAPPAVPVEAAATAAPTPAAPEMVSKAAMQAAFRKVAAEEAERKKREPAQEKPPTQVKKNPPQPKPQDKAAENKPKEGAGMSSAPAAPPRPPSIAGKKILLGAALACVLVYWFWNPTPSGPDACDESLAQAQSAIQQENAQEARRHSQAAIDSCKDKQRALLAKTTDSGAQALLKTQLQAMAQAAQSASADAAVRAAPAAAPVVQTELLRSFIRDAEASMQQRLYDKAKTYAESAQRMDPRNPEVTRLLRRIKEHEMSYLRDRIVIE